MNRRERRLAGASDEELVEACLGGGNEAWEELVVRYKNLVYSAPVKYGLTQQDAADVFQAVWLELYQELPRLRKPGALRSWLMTVALHESYRVKRALRTEGDKPETSAEIADPAVTVAARMGEMQREQILRDAVRKLTPRCQQLLAMLFFSDPPLPYAEAARRLNLAEGSIGFIRGRCLRKLKAALQEAGFLS